MNCKDDVSIKIKEYIIKESFSQDDEIQCDTLIFENSLLDSMGFLFLIDFLKNEFNIDVEDNELINDNFESINTITQFVNKKLYTKKEALENMI
ncbi:MAG: acyl carrier protein [Dysgonamonadaceae bacterium]|nr:acyl carrier protein [Dysgonamonadaceae bacterium]MDD4727855.1 acyl carrier protein [Dysgonamonadaceae bacterium]